MREIIQRHNRLNGLIFSTIEFGLIALIAGTFTIYYLIHQRKEIAIFSSGITLNCAPVVIFGIQQLVEGRAKDDCIRSFWDRNSRERLRRENPHMLRDTLVMTAATLLPFATLAAVLYDGFKSPRQSVKCLRSPALKVWVKHQDCDAVASTKSGILRGRVTANHDI